MASVKLPVVPLGQGKLTTCWYAAYKTMWLWKNKGADVDVIGPQILSIIRKKTGLDTDAMYDRGMWPAEYPMVAKALGLNTFRSTFANTWDVATTVQYLNSYGPMFVCMYNPNHAMVLCGADEDADSEEQLVFMNPWNQKHQGSPAWTKTSMAWFTENLQEYACSLQLWS